MDLFLPVAPNTRRPSYRNIRGSELANSKSPSAQDSNQSHEGLPFSNRGTQSTLKMFPLDRSSQTGRSVHRATIYGPSSSAAQADDNSACPGPQTQAFSKMDHTKDNSSNRSPLHRSQSVHPPTSGSRIMADCSGRDEVSGLRRKSGLLALRAAYLRHRRTRVSPSITQEDSRAGRPAPASNHPVATAEDRTTGTATRHASAEATRVRSMTHNTVSSQAPVGSRSGAPGRRLESLQPARQERLEIRQKAPLPEPEIAYGQIFHYTTCPHVSPPCSRPLNVQPTLVPYRQGLLAFPPLDLLSHPRESTPEIYILDGACGQCDLEARRNAELKVVGKYFSKIDTLWARLYKVQVVVGLDSQTLPRDSDGSTNQPATPVNALTDHSLIVPSEKAQQEILSIEDDLNTLIKRRDREIKFIWRGYTARWGLATLGIVRHRTRPLEELMRASTLSPERSQPMSPGLHGAKPDSSELTQSPSEGSPAMSQAGGSSSTSFNSTSSTSSRYKQHTQDRTTRTSYRGLYDTPKVRFSDGTRPIPLPPPVDDTNENGRMQINWLRKGVSSRPKMEKAKHIEEAKTIGHVRWKVPLTQPATARPRS